MAELGLFIAEDKTEAVLFCDKKPNFMSSITVGNSYIPVGESMKYLGVKIDSFWNFHAHFTYVEAKLNKVLRALNRIMPNLRGPGEKKRRLYATVMTSVMTYAAPIWKGALHSSPYKVQKPLRRIQRIIAIRVIAAYRTTSFDAATLLARMPPWLLEVSLRERVYLRIDESKRLGTFSPLEVNKIKKEESIVLIRQWKALLNEPNTWGKKTIAAILPFLDRWVDRKHGQITYHVAQMLIGHGSFGHFLWRINKRETSACYHCQHEDDTLEHTLFECPVWDNVRIGLFEELGLSLSQPTTLGTIIDKILIKDSAWTAFTEFCNFVIRLKEEEERRREGLISPSPSLHFNPSLN